MDNYSITKELRGMGNRVPVKVQINDRMVEIEDIIWTGFENEGCYKIILKKD